MTTTTKAVEVCPTELLEALRDAETHARELEAQARNLQDQAKVLRQHASMRATRKLGLTPNDSIDIVSGAITRDTPDEVRP